MAFDVDSFFLHSLRDNLLSLLQNILNNLLHRRLRRLRNSQRIRLALEQLLGGIRRQAQRVALLGNLGADAVVELVPLVEFAAASLNNGLVGRSTTLGILLLKRTRVLAQVLADSLLFLLGQQAGRAGAPRQQLELVEVVLAQQLTAEVVDVVTVLNLIFC